MDFSAFDTKKIDEYTKRAKEQWGESKEYREFEQKSQTRTKDDEQMIMKEFMGIFVEFGKLRQEDPGAEAAQVQVQKLKDYITEHFYSCSNEILLSLGQMYSGGGEFTENIDNAGGEGTAAFTTEAIRIYCGEK